MTDVKVGDRVRATLEGVVTQVALGAAYIGGVEIPLDAEGLTVEHLTPTEWPPLRGDLWRDRKGDTWVAMYRFDEAPFIELEPTDGRRGVPLADRNERVRRELGPLTLVHREQQDGGESRHG